MIIVTGGAGFIGSNLVRGLNQSGLENIVVVDDMTDGKKFRNIAGLNISDYLDLHEFRSMVSGEEKIPFKIESIFHQGACTTTTEWDGRYMMDNNFTYSKILFEYSARHEIPFIYASSAAVYGTGTQFSEDQVNEAPVNVYGYSKYLFDQYVRQNQDRLNNQVVGLRYFNVYGYGEQHKGQMASVIFHLNQQLLDENVVYLFQGCGGYGDGEQRRDFIYIEDVIDVNLWFYENKNISGIFNVGTGVSRSFNDVAKSVIAWHGKGEIKYKNFPDTLINSYQSFTEAELARLRNAGFNKKFTPLESGINFYLDKLNVQSPDTVN